MSIDSWLAKRYERKRAEGAENRQSPQFWDAAEFPADAPGVDEPPPPGPWDTPLNSRDDRRPLTPDDLDPPAGPEGRPNSPAPTQFLDLMAHMYPGRMRRLGKELAWLRRKAVELHFDPDEIHRLL